MQNQQKGFSTLEVLIVLSVLCILGLAGWNVFIRVSSINSSAEITDETVQQENVHKRIVAVGDISCDLNDANIDTLDKNYCQDAKTAEIVKKMKPDAVLLLGDLQYNDGSLESFQNAFDKYWGSLKSITYPTPGNHEYVTSQASGYFNYFKNGPVDFSKGYYGFKLGGWQIFSLNSNCDKIGGCQEGSEQLVWLNGELKNSNAKCSLAFWHHPRFTSGEYFGDTISSSRSVTFWQMLSADKTEIVLNGHDHIYERFAPQSSDGKQSADGPRQFTVGTGGKSKYHHKGTTENSQKILDDQFGVLVLDLYQDKYEWEFINIDSQILDSGYQNCI